MHAKLSNWPYLAVKDIEAENAEIQFPVFALNLQVRIKHMPLWLVLMQG